jgi:hypothetical protein
MLCQAEPKPGANELKVAKLLTSFSGVRPELATRKYWAYRQAFDYIDQPLYSLLGNYGNLIPRIRQVYNNDPGSLFKGPSS